MDCFGFKHIFWYIYRIIELFKAKASIMNPKYQIFVSSTYDDLKDARQQVIKATLEMGHIPVGMEMFSAGDDEQWKVITRQIDESDYYVVVVAHRYGSVIEGVSYTEKEYDYAVSKGIPVMGFIISDKASWPPMAMDTDTEKIESLKKFKEKVKQKPINYWDSALDLYGKFSISLSKIFTTNPRTGWIKGSEAMSAEMANELSRLSNENSRLRDELTKALNKEEKDKHAARKEIIEILKANKFEIDFWYKGDKDWSKGGKTDLFEIFDILAPDMLVEKSTIDALEYLARMLNWGGRELREQWPIPRNAFQEYLGDFVSLGLIKPSEKKHSLKDTNHYWTLAEEGREVLKMLKLDKLKANTKKTVKVKAKKKVKAKNK